MTKRAPKIVARTLTLAELVAATGGTATTPPTDTTTGGSSGKRQYQTLP